MSLLISVAVTGLVLSPVFVLAGWLKAPEVAPMRVRFNRTAR